MSVRINPCEPVAIGVDVGGTKITLGSVAANGYLAESHRIANRDARDFTLLLEQVVATVGVLCASIRAPATKLIGIGVATCELVSIDGQVCSATSIPWTRADVVDALSAFGRVTLEADARL